MRGKKSFHLTPDDLRAHPIWVLAMDVITCREGEDEDDAWDDDTSLCVPLPDDPALAHRLLEDCIAYARAEFVAADGRRYVGLMKIGGGDEIQGTHPAIATADGQVAFYLTTHRPSPAELAQEYARLGTSAEALFPLAYRPDAPLPEPGPSGVIEGFAYLEPRGKEYELRYVR